jgi:hypothetical protein
VRFKVERRGSVLLAITLALAAPFVAYGTAATPSDKAAASGQPPIVSVTAARQLPDVASIPEEAAMVLVGTALIGAAAVVRRAA